MTPPVHPTRALASLHVTMIEDVEADFELVRHQLERSGLCARFRKVENEQELVEELALFAPDLVFSDHACAAFDSFRALARVRARFPDVPFIVVSGSMDESLMLQALERGVDDWVSKERPADLLPAVLRALRLAEERRRFRTLESESKSLERQLADHLARATAAVASDR